MERLGVEGQIAQFWISNLKLKSYLPFFTMSIVMRLKYSVVPVEKKSLKKQTEIPIKSNFKAIQDKNNMRIKARE